MVPVTCLKGKRNLFPHRFSVDLFMAASADKLWSGFQALNMFLFVLVPFFFKSFVSNTTTFNKMWGVVWIPFGHLHN